MRELIASLDLAAEQLETAGNKKLAAVVDTVANTMEREASRPTEGYVFGPGHPKVKDKKGHFPIPDASHARNALARANQYSEAPDWFDGTLKQLKEAVARAVKSKFKSIEVTEKSVD